jgi:hypothetical protein
MGNRISITFDMGDVENTKKCTSLVNDANEACIVSSTHYQDRLRTDSRFNGLEKEDVEKREKAKEFDRTGCKMVWKSLSEMRLFLDKEGREGAADDISHICNFGPISEMCKMRFPEEGNLTEEEKQ